MTRDDEVCLSLGREVVRMIHDLRNVSRGETGYCRRCLTFPGGAVHLLLANDPALADLMEAAARRAYDVITAIPPSQTD